MKKLTQSLLVACAALFSAGAMANPVLLGSVEHLYGTNAGRQLSSIMDDPYTWHPGGNCDTANANSITVRATKSSDCNRFADAFDFSSIAFDSIDHFELTLSFSGAQNQKSTGFLKQSERWNVRGAANYVDSAFNFGSQLNANGTQTFSFNNSNTWFSKILGVENFFVSFATNQGATMNFDLSSAKLELFGTAPVAQVPEPGSLALLGLSALALVGARRARKAKTV